MIKRLLFTFLLVQILTNGSFSQPSIEQSISVTGESIKTLENKKDIYHVRNQFFREQMIEEAIFDAIEQVAPIHFSSMIQHVQSSTSVEKSFEEVYEDYLSSTLTRYNVQWHRTSGYKFARMEGKTWKCRVEGEIISIDGEYPDTVHQVKIPGESQDYFITRKSFNIVHINAGENKGIRLGDEFVAWRYKRKRTINGYNFVAKPAGLIKITNIDERFCVGRIVKGMYGVHTSQQVSRVNFKAYRLGLEYRLSGSYEQVNTTEFGEKESTTNIISHSLFLYYNSLFSRFGFRLGLEVFDVDKKSYIHEFSSRMADTSTYVFYPKISLNYSIGLIPDVLYLQPEISGGYLFFEEGSELLFDCCDNPWGADVMIEGGILAVFRFGCFDISGGITYKYANDYPELSNYYPHVGLGFNFTRYSGRAIREIH